MTRYRNTWVEIDLAAIRHNIKALTALQPDQTKALAVVKADGYGHGSVQVAKAVIEAGTTHLMVALLEEAMTLREHGITVPIIVITRVQPQHAPIAAANDIILTVYAADWINEAAKQAYTKPLQTHMEFETGMGRTGVQSKGQINELVAAYNETTDILLTGVYTHFATADEKDPGYFKEQSANFTNLLNHLQSVYNHELIVHTGNSAAGIQFPEKMNHYTRFGIATYGQYPSTHIQALRNIELREAFALYSELIQVKQIAAGECVSYGATYCATEAEWIGTIPIGYADGWTRKLQGFHVLVNGKKMPIVGRICMDAMMIKLDGPYEVGTKVTLIGTDGTEKITVDDVANYIGTINYEVTCMISKRVPREYI